ncbi:MAG: sterol desaturase family protein [Timaviella obliquedivisa GSE-PSE-MK23-08B]|nr:sterol desaturase family protein [Timaviella obliquedivisa GSE-PSE-MK23-08B]
MSDYSFWLYWFILSGAILGRYFLIAGGAHLVFYAWLGKSAVMRGKPSERRLLWRSIHRDVKLSIISTVIFALCAALILSAYDFGLTRLYTNPQDYGLWYLGLSFVAVLMLQDTYFYFTHRLFHHPAIFKRIHQGHHRSTHPTPWTSFAFDPPEALSQAFFLVVIVFLMPLHFATLAAVLTTMTLWSVLNHLGFERSSPSAIGAWLGRGLIGPKHHLIHHRQYKVHYGLYFTFWDKLLGTQDPNCQ